MVIRRAASVASSVPLIGETIGVYFGNATARWRERLALRILEH